MSDKGERGEQGKKKELKKIREGLKPGVAAEEETGELGVYVASY